MAKILVSKSAVLPGWVYMVDGKYGPPRGVSYTGKQRARDAAERHAALLDGAKPFSSPAEEERCRELRPRINEQTFYLRVLPMMVGKEFDMPRGYGHAKYEVTGMIGAPVLPVTCGCSSSTSSATLSCLGIGCILVFSNTGFRRSARVATTDCRRHRWEC